MKSLCFVVAALGAVVGPTLVPVAPFAAYAQEIGRADFFKPGIAPVRQPGPHDVTIVYFMDYQCPACRKHTPDVARVLKEDRRVRVIYRDTPIFGPKSEAAARAAIASQFQGKHEAFHHALMMSSGGLDDAAIRAAADEAGVDWTRLQRDMKARAAEIDTLIDRNHELSQAAGISGTPAFVIGDTLADGALDYRGLKGEIADARRKAGTTPAASPDPGPETQEPAATTEEEVAPDAPPADNKVEVAPAEDPAEATVPFKEATASVTAPDSAEPGEKAARPIWPWLLAGLAVAALAVIGWFRSRRKDESASL